MSTMAGYMGHDAGGMVRNPTSSLLADTSSHMAGEADRNGNVQSQTYMDNAGMELSSGTTISSRFSRGSVSASTTETTLTSPSDPIDYNLCNKANTNITYAKTNRVLQPHQGKNPTVERNTHKRSDEELAVLGNTLVDKSVVEAAQGEPHQRGQTNRALTDDLIEAITDNLESSLVQNDLLNQQRHHPTCYIQNQVNLSEPLIVRPKQPNVPGNGVAHHSRAVPAEPKQKSKFKFKKSKEKGKGLGLSIFSRNPFASSKPEQHSDDSGNYPTENLRNPAPAPQLAMLKKMSGHQRSRSDGGSNLSKSNLEPRQVPTEVCLMNGSAIVRPTSLPLKNGKSGQPQSTKYNVDKAAKNAIQTTDTRLGVAELGIAKLQTNCPVNGQPAIIKTKQKSQSNIDLSPSNSSRSSTPGVNGLIDTGAKLHRPNSWQMGTENYKNGTPPWNSSGHSDSNHNVIENGHTGSGSSLSKLDPLSDYNSKDTVSDHLPTNDKVIKRIKTPTSKNGRFSLYDDRMMSQSNTDVAMGKQKIYEPMANSSISLHQFGSVDHMDVNKLQAADFRC